LVFVPLMRASRGAVVYLCSPSPRLDRAFAVAEPGRSARDLFIDYTRAICGLSARPSASSTARICYFGSLRTLPRPCVRIECEYERSVSILLDSYSSLPSVRPSVHPSSCCRRPTPCRPSHGRL